MPTPQTLSMVAGIDVGNGYVKGKAAIDGAAPVSIDLPSSVSYTVGSNVAAVPTDEYMDDFVNKLDTTITSRGVRPMDTGRVFFGRRGILTGESQTEFNIENHVPKCEESLSSILVMGSVAATALRHLWFSNHELPERVDVTVMLGLALPIEDYTDYRDRYRQTLMAEPHHVMIHNFERAIDVCITVADVVVLAEGAAGQYAISSLGANFLDAALTLARSQGVDIDAAYTGEMLQSAQNTVGIDIGEGTTNFPVFSNGNISIESSTSINRGYGSVLTAVVAELRNTNYAFNSRKELADFLLEENLMPAQQRVRAYVQKTIDRQVRVFVRDIIKEYSNIFRKVGIRTEVVYVYGGGAAPVKDVLYPMLVEASKLDGESSLPIVYLDSAFSRDLNRNGLFNVACLQAKADAERA